MQGRSWEPLGGHEAITVVLHNTMNLLAITRQQVHVLAIDQGEIETAQRRAIRHPVDLVDYLVEGTLQELTQLTIGETNRGTTLIGVGSDQSDAPTKKTAFMV
jgi:RecB family endonuclease NucS